MAEKPATPASIRALLREKMPPEMIVDEIIESFRGALREQKDISVVCSNPKCGRRTKVMIPNLDVRVRAAVAMLSELEGKVGTQSKPPPVVKVSGDLDELSDDELLALLNSTEDAHGETDSSTEAEASG